MDKELMKSERKGVLESIGRTPLVELESFSTARVKIYAKLEFFNPGGSVKDRIALRMIEEAENSGKLSKDKIIIEATSGNTGIGLAMVAAKKGYRLKIAMPESMSEERRAILRAYGVDLVLTPAEEGMNGAIEYIRQLSQEDGYFWINQFENQANVEAHYQTTGVEILNQIDRVDVLVAGIGTGGTITGVARRLKEKFSDLKVVGVEPRADSPIQGLRCLDHYVPPIIDFSLIDEIRQVSQEAASYWVKELVKREGLFLGFSSGAAIKVAYEEAQKLNSGKVVTIFPDNGFKYVSDL
jgi:cysteine synthase